MHADEFAQTLSECFAGHALTICTKPPPSRRTLSALVSISAFIAPSQSQTQQRLPSQPSQPTNTHNNTPTNNETCNLALSNNVTTANNNPVNRTDPIVQKTRIQKRPRNSDRIKDHSIASTRPVNRRQKSAKKQSTCGDDSDRRGGGGRVDGDDVGDDDDDDGIAKKNNNNSQDDNEPQGSLLAQINARIVVSATMERFLPPHLTRGRMQARLDTQNSPASISTPTINLVSAFQHRQQRERREPQPTPAVSRATDRNGDDSDDTQAQLPQPISNEHDNVGDAPVVSNACVALGMGVQSRYFAAPVTDRLAAMTARRLGRNDSDPK